PRFLRLRRARALSQDRQTFGGRRRPRAAAPVRRMMKEYAALVGHAKSSIDRGFSQVGRELDADGTADRVLMLLAARAVAVGNALVLLAQNSLPNEALPR